MKYSDYLKNTFEREPKLKSGVEFNTWLIELGHQVSRLRKERGYSQTVFAEKLGIKQSFVARIEAGQNMKCSTLWDLSEVLRLDLNIFGAVKSLEVGNVQRAYMPDVQINNLARYTVLDQATTLCVSSTNVSPSMDMHQWKVVATQPNPKVFSSNIL